MLGTGFNVPEVDLVALLRARPAAPGSTCSRSAGRFDAPRQGRCADPRLCRAGADARAGGCRDRPERRPGARRGRGLRAKPCPGCGALIALNASTCEACWTEPEVDAEAEALHEAAADDELPILSTDPGSLDSEPAGPAPAADTGWHETSRNQTSRNQTSLERDALASGDGPEPGGRTGRPRPRARLAGRRVGSAGCARAPAARAQRLRAREGGPTGGAVSAEGATRR
ncbi:hypothetical protein ACU4GR_05100 [Methylobacterium oryzae CBMB20]